MRAVRRTTDLAALLLIWFAFVLVSVPYSYIIPRCNEVVSLCTIGGCLLMAGNTSSAQKHCADQHRAR